MSDIEMEDTRAVFGPAPKRGLRHYASTSMDRLSLTEMYQSPFIEFTVGDDYEGITTIRLAVNAEGYTLMLKLMDMLHKEVNKDEIVVSTPTKTVLVTPSPTATATSTATDRKKNG